FGLSPSFLHDELGVHVTQPLVGGLFAAGVVFVNGVAQLALRHRVGSESTNAGLAGIAIGMAIVAASAPPHSLALLGAGGVLVGAGSGAVQMNSMATIQRIAPVHVRGSVVSAYLTAGYVALSLPVIIAGETADRVGLSVVTGLYFVALVVLAASAYVFARR